MHRPALPHKALKANLLFFAVLMLSGCLERETIVKVDLTQTIETKATSEDSSTIRIGIIPEQNIRAMTRRYEPLVDYLRQKLNTKVVLVYLNSYSEACDKFIYQQLDAAFMGSFNYVLTRAKVGIEPIARPEYSGVSVYRGLVLVRSDSGIRKVSEMKGKRLALVHHATYTGSLFPLYYFKANGVVDFQNYFSEVSYTGSHDKAILALLNGEVDVAIAKDKIYRRLIEENPDWEKKFEVLSLSEPVPTNTFCVRKQLDQTIKEKLKMILCGLDKDIEATPVLEALNKASKFVETRDEDYQLIYLMVKELGIDLLTYPYHEKD